MHQMYAGSVRGRLALHSEMVTGELMDKVDLKKE
jgi:hypothetical protein